MPALPFPLLVVLAVAFSGAVQAVISAPLSGMIFSLPPRRSPATQAFTTLAV